MKQEVIAQGRYNSRLTLVPFAGISLIRFRGSRINGLSPAYALGTPTRNLHFILQAASFWLPSFTPVTYWRKLPGIHSVAAMQHE